MAGSPLCDPQREQLYRMEAEEFGVHGYHRATRKWLRCWNRNMAKLMDVPVPKLRFGSCGSGYGGEYDPNTQTIKLSPQGGPCGLFLCHEFAHHVQHQKRPKAESHGRFFCRVYMELLDKMRLVPAEGFRAAARRHGVKISRARTLPPTRPSS